MTRHLNPIIFMMAVLSYKLFHFVYNHKLQSTRQKDLLQYKSSLHELINKLLKYFNRCLLLLDCFLGLLNVELFLLQFRKILNAHFHIQRQINYYLVVAMKHSSLLESFHLLQIGILLRVQSAYKIIPIDFQVLCFNRKNQFQKSVLCSPIVKENVHL